MTYNWKFIKLIRDAIWSTRDVLLRFVFCFQTCLSGQPFPETSESRSKHVHGATKHFIKRYITTLTPIAYKVVNLSKVKPFLKKKKKRTGCFHHSLDICAISDELYHVTHSFRKMISIITSAQYDPLDSRTPSKDKFKCKPVKVLQVMSFWNISQWISLSQLWPPSLPPFFFFQFGRWYPTVNWR